MSRLDAMVLAEAARRKLVDLSLDEAYLQDPVLREVCRKIWAGPGETGGLVADLVVEGAFPPATVDVEELATLDALASAGLFTKTLRDQLNTQGVWPRARLLRKHQQEPIMPITMIAQSSVIA